MYGLLYLSLAQLHATGIWWLLSDEFTDRLVVTYILFLQLPLDLGPQMRGLRHATSSALCSTPGPLSLGSKLTAE